ncbi:hypothetical protein AMS68_002174 [Peltaster fructicola]|uniref:Uncharacterized protein n=1 Tax=Peltaster fructicola TaxID=286661 RepID=A0A6H0XPG7_9PEZI|nr:hypothetical protein AMS68_002174 [Peltaster fructicola]
MSSAKLRGSVLELCTSTAALGNNIAVHILEYMNIARSQPFGFKEAAIELLEVGRLLVTARAALGATSQSRAPSALESQELGDFIRQTNATLILVDSSVSKLLADEGKHGFKKFGKDFRNMFATQDFTKLKGSLALCHQTLKSSMAAQGWTLSGDKSETAGTVGYTALAAVLGRSDPVRPDNASRATDLTDHYFEQDQQLPPSSYNTSPPLPRDSTTTSNGFDYRRGSSFGQPPLPSTRTTTDTSQPFSTGRSISNADNVSAITRMSSVTGRDEPMPPVPTYDGNVPKHALRISADPSTVPRWSPKHHNTPITPASEMALVNAVHQKNSKLVEQLLDRGVSPDHAPELGLLKDAVSLHDYQTLRLLLLYGADPNSKDKSGNTALFTATADGFLEAAQLLVEYGADPNAASGASQMSPFAISLADGKAPFAQLFLKYCADTDCILPDGNTPLVRAISEATPSNVVELLLLYGADTNRKNTHGESALFKAITAQRLDIVTLLLDHNADPNLPAPKHMLWPSVHNPAILELLLERGANLKRAPGVLELATSINSFDAVSILLKHGADPNAKKDGIFTPLCTAIRDDREMLIDVLIAAGADPNLPASEYPAFKCVTHRRPHLLPRILLAGANPSNPKGIIETAVAHKQEEALLMLLEHKVDPNVRSTNGNTALTTAIKNNDAHFIDILLSHGADPGVRGQEWPIAMAVKHPDVLAKLLPRITTAKIIKGALEMAVVANQLESVKLLLAKGISVEEKNGGVFSPLTTSIREDRKEIFRYLIDEAGADPNSPGEHLPIIKAIRRHRENDLSYIEHLLTKGADINLMYRGWNAVLQAVDNGDVKILKLLAEVAHPDLEAKDENGRTVLEIMDERGLQEEERILLRRRTPSPEVFDALNQLQSLATR